MKRSIRNIVKIAAIATALSAGSSVALGQGFQGPLDSDAYGAQERADIQAGVSSYGPDVALPSGTVQSPLASDSDAFGAGERAAIAAEVASPSTAVALPNGPFETPVASNSDAYGAGERAAIAADQKREGDTFANAASQPHG